MRTWPQTSQRGFNEDFGFPNSAQSRGAARQPASGRREHADGDGRGARSDPHRNDHDRRKCRRHRTLARPRWPRPACAASSRSRSATAKTWPARCRPNGCRSEAPRFSAKLRDEGMQRINDLFATWHGAKQGRISVFPAAALAETSSPELLQAVRAFAEKHDLGYTIHLSQSRAEVDFMVRHHGVRPPAFLDPARLPRPAAVRGALPLCRRCRHRAARQIGHDHFAPGGDGGQPRRHPADRRRCAPPAARLPTAPTTTPTICSR